MSEFVVDGKPLSSLRVVDLKEELEKRGLSKSGTKKDLHERLKAFLTTEKERADVAAAAADEEQLPNISIQQKLADQNPFLRDYFQSQAELFHEQKRVQKVYLEEKKRESEASADEGGSSPSKSRGGSPLKSPSQSPAKRGSVSEQAPVPTMVLANESPVKLQNSPKKSVEEVIPSVPVQINRSPQRPTEDAAKKPIAHHEKTASPVKDIVASQPVLVEETVPHDRSPRKSARNREPEPPAMVVEPIKGNISPTKNVGGDKSPQKLAHDDGAKPAGHELKGLTDTIKETSPRRRSSREIVAKPDDAIQADVPDQENSRIRTRRGSQQTRTVAPQNNSDKAPETINKVQENNLSAKIIPEEKPADKDKQQEEEPAESRRKRGGSAIIFDVKKDESKESQKAHEETRKEPDTIEPESKKIPLRTRAERFKMEEFKEPQKAQEEPKKETDVIEPEGKKIPLRTRAERFKMDEFKEPQKAEEESKKESDENGSESKRISLRTRAERFKKDVVPPPTNAVEQEKINHKPVIVPNEQTRKMSSSSEESGPTQIAAAPRPRRGGREIVFDIKAEKMPPPARPPAKRAIALLSTEELASDEVLDFGDDDKDKKEETQVEREPWIPRKINVQNKAPPPENLEKGWAKKEITKDEEEINHLNQTWQYIKETYYSDLELMPDDDLKLDAHDSSFDDKNFGRQFDDFQITRTISNEFAAENGNKMEIETQAEPAKPRKRMISEIIEDEDKPVSPSRNPPSEVIKITNLVRPFTLTQLRALLQRTGSIVDLWLDKIKSKCVVKYEEEAQALETRAAIHGVAWPSSNTKYLRVDYSTTEELEELRNKELNDEKPKVEENKDSSSTSATIRAWDVGKDGRVKRRSRSLSKEKELDRKRPRRSSRSPDERGARRDRDHHAEHAVEKKEPVKTGKALDELFRKTVATPCIYWLPLTSQQIAEKEEIRRRRMLERDRTISEMQQRDLHPREQDRPPRFR